MRAASTHVGGRGTAAAFTPRRPAVGRERAVLGLLVSAGGALLALAFPRTNWGGAAWVALVPVIVAAMVRPPRAAFAWGWLGGFVFFITLLRWLNFTFGMYSTIPWPITWLPTALLSGYCALWFAVFAWTMAVVARRAPALALAAAPFAWVATEWLRGHLLGGFPWGSLGYSQSRQLAVIQIAELSGVSAVSFVLAAVNAALAGCLVLSPRRAAVGLALAASLVGATVAFGAARLRAPAPPAEVAIAVMQPSIEQPLKWDPRHTEETLRVYAALTEVAAAAHPDLFVWPESAAPTILRRDPALLASLRATAGRARMPLLVGTIDVVEGPRPTLRNSAFLVTAQGIVGRYDKIHLVPFGEFVPLSGVIGFVRGWAAFISELEPGSRAVVFPGPPAPFGVVICYEGIFPDLVRRFVRGGAQLMVNMTNDAWFGRTSGPEQHLAMYPLRAVEHRIAVVRAANTGLSAFIAPTGAISRRLPLFDRGVMTERVPLRRGTTWFTRVGDWLAYLSFLVCALAVALARRPSPASRAAGAR